MLTTVEKVLFLQDVDIFEFTASDDLARIAAVTEHVEVAPGTVLYREGEAADAMYLVLEGRVRFTRDGREVLSAGPRDLFGTWALFDDEPRVVTAKAVESTRLLKLNEDDFIDLLDDYVDITRSILKTLVKRLRRLMGRSRERSGGIGD